MSIAVGPLFGWPFAEYSLMRYGEHEVNCDVWQAKKVYMQKRIILCSLLILSATAVGASPVPLKNADGRCVLNATAQLFCAAMNALPDMQRNVGRVIDSRYASWDALLCRDTRMRRILGSMSLNIDTIVKDIRQRYELSAKCGIPIGIASFEMVRACNAYDAHASRASLLSISNAFRLSPAALESQIQSHFSEHDTDIQVVHCAYKEDSIELWSSYQSVDDLQAAIIRSSIVTFRHSMPARVVTSRNGTVYDLFGIMCWIQPHMLQQNRCSLFRQVPGSQWVLQAIAPTTDSHVVAAVRSENAWWIADDGCIWAVEGTVSRSLGSAVLQAAIVSALHPGIPSVAVYVKRSGKSCQDEDISPSALADASLHLMRINRDVKDMVSSKGSSTATAALRAMGRSILHGQGSAVIDMARLWLCTGSPLIPACRTIYPGTFCPA